MQRISLPEATPAPVIPIPKAVVPKTSSLPLPPLSLQKVLAFLPLSQIPSSRLICRQFNSVFWSNLKKVSLLSPCLPESILHKFLDKSLNMQVLALGPAKSMTMRSFKGVIIRYNYLKSLDLSRYQGVHEKVLSRFINNCKAIESIKLHYNTKTSSE